MAGLEPYRFAPERAADSTDNNSEVELNDPLENVLWCSCERCSIMPTQRECVCCRRQPESVIKMEGTFCSTITRQLQWTHLVQVEIYF